MQKGPKPRLVAHDVFKNKLSVATFGRPFGCTAALALGLLLGPLARDPKQCKRESDPRDITCISCIRVSSFGPLEHVFCRIPQTGRPASKDRFIRTQGSEYIRLGTAAYTWHLVQDTLHSSTVRLLQTLEFFAGSRHALHRVRDELYQRGLGLQGLQPQLISEVFKW